jgi:hypothetical protein
MNWQGVRRILSQRLLGRAEANHEQAPQCSRLPQDPLDQRDSQPTGNNQNLMLFIRGNAMSGAPSISGTSQFPNPPIIMGITMKKIMTKAWAVTITL